MDGEAQSNMDQAPPQNSSALLRLPAELRNAIYEYVLLRPGKITITSTLPEPMLLRTNKQVRAETRKLWLSANVFKIVIREMDYSLFVKWSKVLQAAGITKGPMVDIRKSFKWAKLVEWCRYVWENHGSHSVQRSEGQKQVPAVVSAAHWIAVRNRGQPWARVVEELENLHSAVSAAQPKWKEDKERTL